MSTGRRWLALGACVGLAGAAPAAEPAARVRIAAFFWHESANDEAAFVGFRSGLRTAALGWDVRVFQAGGDPEHAQALLAAIGAGRFDGLLAMGTQATRAARAALPGLPIVFTAVTNPVETGIVPDWQGSGQRLAGNSNWLPARELLATFRATVPQLRRLGVVRDPENPVARAEVLEAVEALREHQPDVRLRVEDVLRAEGLTQATERLRDAGIDALWVPIDHLVYTHLAELRAVCDPAGIPILTSAAAAAREGAVVGVVPDYHVLGLQAAEIARRVLVEHADPATLPVGRLRTFRTIVNLQAATRCRHRVPLPVLAVADEVIR